ncbi:phenylacrylic acid decarboxylase [Bradyrhizobium oligotrophicum S58]|uniref:Phenylacrylic acid decarboxylase n=1 Tax=Bradyrhizobium oligotrophicum S58 TaxID=1245469 RepID=M4ZU64_9BRAD|nr:tail fiber protein [Bradyrhizobium oligotrophicum]BAM89855.1 phenylacrylic acid decarboxylase [Bradyrhizobium oligotrophicum S58]
MPVQPFLGQIMPFAGSFAPRGWAFCNGALLAIQPNQALFSLLGTYYGGNGVSTFGLPDLRGRAILGSTGGGGDYPAGMVSGATTVTLNASQIPAHNHFIQVSTTQGAGRGALPTNNLFATNTIPADNPRKIFANAGQGEVPLALSTNLTDTGGGLAHNNMQPYLVINYLIATQGTYPSRS